MRGKHTAVFIGQIANSFEWTNSKHTTNPRKINPKSPPSASDGLQIPWNIPRKP